MIFDRNKLFLFWRESREGMGSEREVDREDDRKTGRKRGRKIRNKGGEVENGEKEVKKSVDMLIRR